MVRILGIAVSDKFRRGLLLIICGVTIVLLQPDQAYGTTGQLAADSSGTLRDIDLDGSADVLTTSVGTISAGIFGSSDYRALITFDLSPIPSGSVISQATFTLFFESVLGSTTTDVSLFGYPATGPVSGPSSLGDWQTGSLISTFALDPVATVPPRYLTPVDATSHVANVFVTGVAAFRLQAGPTGTLYRFTDSGGVWNPRLSVTYSAAPPAPSLSALSLMVLAGAFCVLVSVRVWSRKARNLSLR